MKRFTLLLFTLGLFSLVNAQVFWEEVSIPEPGASIAAINIDDNGHIVMVTEDKLFYSDNDGDTWTESDNWPGYWPSRVEFNSNYDIFVSTSSDGMLKSTDGGATFTAINNGLEHMNVWSMIILENDDIILATAGGIYKSTDDGDSWSSYGTGLPDDELIAVVVADNGDMFAGTMENGVYRSDDNGVTWQEANTGLPEGSMVTAMGATPDGGVYTGLFPEGVFRTVDYGNLWEEYNNGLPFNTAGFPDQKGSSIDVFFVIPLFLMCIIYFYGMFYLPIMWDMDYSWYPLNGGLPDEPTTTCIAYGPGDRLFLGTMDQGLYKNAIPVSIEDNKLKFKEMVVYNSPNPFNSYTNIKFYLPQNSHVKISVFNQNGSEVEILMNKDMNQGSHEVDWYPENMAKGIYLLKVQSGSTCRTSKLVYN